MLFSDSDWPQGSAQLGYGRSRQATTVGFGPDYDSKYITTYFRRSLGSVPGAQSLILRVLRDDGVAVYLNNQEVFRDNLSRTADYLTPAASDINATLASLLVSTNVAATNLTGRANIIAAEVHQSSPSSPDLAFDLELSAVVNLKPTVSLIEPQPNSLIMRPANLTLRATGLQTLTAPWPASSSSRTASDSGSPPCRLISSSGPMHPRAPMS